MPYFTPFLLSKFDQPLVNAAKAAKPEVPKPSLVFATPTAPAQAVGVPLQSVKSGEGRCTASRAELAEAFPSLVAKQQYHLKQLRAHLPVHRSGRFDHIMLPMVYAGAVIFTGMSFYGYYELIKES